MPLFGTHNAEAGGWEIHYQSMEGLYTITCWKSEILGGDLGGWSMGGNLGGGTYHVTLRLLCVGIL